MSTLTRLATAIKLSRIRNSEELLEAAAAKNNKRAIKDSPSLETSPTRKEQEKHETGVSFGESIDMSSEPSTEYLN
jgi:hypothetical protein